MKSDIATNDTLDQRLKVLRKLLIVVGGVAIVIAFLADWLGLGQPGNFGSGQFLLVAAAIIVLLIGSLGRRFFKLYRGVAVFLLNVLVLLACLELGAIIIARSGILPSYRQSLNERYQNLPYYRTQNWAKIYWSEARLAEIYRYRPYVVWRHLHFNGETIKIGHDGIRQTPGADCHANAYKIFAFGGSTMWSWGSPDSLTIAAYLQAGLQDLISRPVCVTNLGEDGFVSTQSLIVLITQLQSGNVPDAVIFYDGANDVFAAYESGHAGVHLQLASIAAKFEQREHPLVKWIKGTRLYALINDLVSKQIRDRKVISPNRADNQSKEIDTGHLADAVMKIYLSNYRIVQKDSQIWIDEWGHVTPEGNRLVAQEMLAIIKNPLLKK